MKNLELFFFGIYPYIALAICVLGCWIRYDREPYTWRADSSQMMSKKNTRWANNLFHIGILGILGGHFVGLLTPESVYHNFISSPAKQLLAMVAGGIFGLMCLVGLVMLLHRRWINERVKVQSSFGDRFILILLLAQLCLGLISIFTSAGHMDGQTMVALGKWVQSGWTFSTFEAYEGIAHVSWIYKLHIIIGFTIILTVPFTRLVHAISTPIWYLGRSYQIVRSRGQFSSTPTSRKG